MNLPRLTPDTQYLRDKFIYDEATGNLLIRHASNKYKAGDVAGWARDSGHICVQIEIDGRRKHLQAHRVIWQIVYGGIPDVIDHIDGNRANNRICNLRSATYSINAQNQRKAQTRSKTGLLGVTTNKKGVGYSARIHLNGHRTSLGSYATPEEAHQAYLVGKRKIHEGCTI